MDLYHTLPAAVQRDIDRAFLDVTDDDAIAMADVPRALQRLDLPPDDEQVLAVFRNAASGWAASSSSAVDTTGGGLVSRDDWRAVCAVLLEQSPENDNSDDDGEDDPYLEEDTGDDSSSDEYSPTSSKHTTRRHRFSPSPSSSPKKLTKRQLSTTLSTFALFFPSVPPEDLPNQKILIKDIQRVAALLGENIKADEMLEMLDAFSTSPDKSVSLDDFGRIMVATRLT